MNEKKPYIELPDFPKQIAPNFVMVRLDILNKNRKTPSGIIMTSGREDDKLDSNDIFDQIDRYGTVVMLPPYLYFKPGRFNSLEYKTKMEVEIGDVVWMRQIEANVALRLKIKGDYYKIVRYDCFNVAKRGDKVIPLNGQVLMERIIAESSKLIVTPFKVSLKDVGIVRYCGSKNEDYSDNYIEKQFAVVKIGHFEDAADIQPGDKVHYQIVEGHHCDEIFLESAYINTFGEKLKLCQRRHIIMTIN